MIPGSANPLLLKSAAAAAGGYQVSRSLRFNSSDSAFCSRTPAVAGNRRTFTFSTWVKRSKLSSGFQQLICSYDGSTGSTYFSLIFTPSDTIRVEDISVIYRETTQVFRDASAWYCIQLAVDTTQATAANRIKLYVNGSEVTTFATTNNPTQNTDFGINNTVAHAIGRSGAQSAYYQDGYLADIHFIDGQALTPSSFTEVSATTGQLIPLAYSGSFGTNGFWLKFSDNSAATAATLGKDYSGNSNNWTPNNLSVTAGVGNDSLVDTPTSYGTDTGVGGSVRGNYCTLNPLDKGANVTLTNGNLDVSTASTWNAVRSTLGVASGKWYWEYTMTAAGDTMFGIGTGNLSLSSYVGNVGNTTGYAYHSPTGNKWNNGAAVAYGSSFTINDVLGVAFDADSGKIWFAKNGTWQASGNPAAGTNAAYSSVTAGTYFPMFSQDNSSGATGGATNFGQRAFAYTAPSGFKALCDTNLPAPLTAKPSTVFDVITYTGTGATQTLPNASSTPSTPLGFSPDLVWIKTRSDAASHNLLDTIRGARVHLESNTTNSVYTESAGFGLTAFNSDGFSLGTDNAGPGQVNASGGTFVAWAWDAGTSTVSNPDGSITSQVRANASAGFSVVTYTGNGSAGATIGHGLGVAPAFLIIKGRGHVSSWHCYHSAIGNTSAIFLSSTSASVANSVYWNNTSPGSTTFTVGTSDGMNGDTNTYVAYCFSSVVGYSNGFSYTGNGSADGSFVYLGFRPRLIMLKRSDSTSNWTLLDTSREGYNVDNDPLYPNLVDAEGTTDLLDITSNGFKLRSTNASVNASAGTYIGFAWAENPFQYARAR